MTVLKMSNTVKNEKGHYTWKDYLTWPDNERWEIIYGEPVAMAPAPTSTHQALVLNIAISLKNIFKGEKCQTFVSPIDVKLSEDLVVQPDVIVVCDKDKLKETHLEGAPDLAVEVVSKSSMATDRIRKLNIYAAFGIREYWIFTPSPGMAEIFVLKEGKYVLEQAYERNGILKSSIFPFLKIDLAEIFDFPLSPEEEEIKKLSLREPQSTYGG